MKNFQNVALTIIGVGFTLSFCQGMLERIEEKSAQAASKAVPAQVSKNKAVVAMANEFCTNWRPGMTGRELGFQLFDQLSTAGVQDEWMTSMMQFKNMEEMTNALLGTVKAQCPAVYEQMNQATADV